MHTTLSRTWPVQEDGADTLLCHDAGRKLKQFQAGGILSALNAGQLNQAAVQQLAQAGVLSAATNGAVVSQGNLNLGAPPRVADVLMIGLAGRNCRMPVVSLMLGQSMCSTCQELWKKLL